MALSKRGVLAGFTVLLIATSGAASAATDLEKCIATKRTAVGKTFSQLIGCDSKATKKGVAVDPACETKANDRLTAQWSKVETRYGASCATAGVQATLDGVIDAARDALGTSQGVPGAASICTASKLKASGKAGACGMKCGSKAQTSGLPDTDVSVSECRSECQARLAARISDAEAKPGADCHTTGDEAAIATATNDFVTDALAELPPATPPVGFCDQPGAIRFTAMGTTEVPGGSASWPDLSFLHLPEGFCAHYFATVPNARQVRFAPGGELFVASPSKITTGGGGGGLSSIVILPDDDGDGVADSQITYLSGLPATQGLLFTNGYFYYQDDSVIRRRPYTSGDRAPQSPAETVSTITHYYSNLHWPKPLDVADDGTIYMGNGGDQGETCSPGSPFTGGIMKLDSANGTPVSRGFRNPISVRCSRGHNLCFAIELALDYSTPYGGREKLVPIQDGADVGFPCCASRNMPYSYVMPIPDCSSVSMEGVSFLIGNTPFGLDFAPADWPAPYSGSAFVSEHGAAGTWSGARLVAVDMDETTGLPLPGSDASGMNTGSMSDFGTGWDDETYTHGRPADLSFSSDGRLFLANDNNGVIIWIAPIE
jgi:glucose/arabinose dehydrogenase